MTTITVLCWCFMSCCFGAILAFILCACILADVQETWTGRVLQPRAAVDSRWSD
jgi:hypothetical protein